MPIQCQCSATWNYCFTQALASIEAIGRVKQSEMNQCSANEVPMECHSELLFYSGTCLYRGIWPSKTIWDEPMQCHCATAKSLCHWITTWTKFPPMDVKNSQWIVNSPMPCHLNHSCVTSTTGITIRIICHPVFIVQLKFMGPLLGHLPL